MDSRERVIRAMSDQLRQIASEFTGDYRATLIKAELDYASADLRAVAEKIKRYGEEEKKNVTG